MVVSLQITWNERVSGGSLKIATTPIPKGYHYYSPEKL
jgi:hypothetical protein